MRETAMFLIPPLMVGFLTLASSVSGSECKPEPTPAIQAGSVMQAPAVAKATPANPVVAPAAARPCESVTAAPVATPVPAEAGMRVYLDPESGTIGGVPPAGVEEVAVQPGLEEQPVETVLPDGSVMLDLKGHGQEYFIMQLDANGNRVTRCVQEDPKAALKTVPTPKPEDR
jgi:hypothetical protein